MKNMHVLKGQTWVLFELYMNILVFCVNIDCESERVKF